MDQWNKYEHMFKIYDITSAIPRSSAIMVCWCCVAHLYEDSVIIFHFWLRPTAELSFHYYFVFHYYEEFFIFVTRYASHAGWNWRTGNFGTIILYFMSHVIIKLIISVGARISKRFKHSLMLYILYLICRCEIITASIARICCFEQAKSWISETRKCAQFIYLH